MNPTEKRAARKCAVGYLRVSSQDQTKGWSLRQQESVIRAWSDEHRIPLIALVQAPDGWESGKDFTDRTGWQEVERHLSTGRVGWIAVATIDRLGRNLKQLAERMRAWEDDGIAVVAPGMGYGDPVGVGRFMLQLHGLLAEHERHQLIGRTIPGMKARIAAGLPLGRLPLGYQLVTEPSKDHPKSRPRLVADPATAPMIKALFVEALNHPEAGDRKMAAWATQQWPSWSWSPGRITGILTNAVYTGMLEGSVCEDAIVRPDNHPALIDLADFTRLQAIRAQRAEDCAHGLDAVRAISWLGGIVRCGCCGSEVTWRETSASPSGRYECRGSSGSSGCGTFWLPEIEVFVVRALERILEEDAGRLRALATDAIERLPEQFDERRKRAASELEAVRSATERLTDDLAEGRLDGDAYAKTIEAFEVRRASAESLLAETDGWEYLARLVIVRDGPAAGALRWVTIQESIFRLSLPERRRLLRALSPTITLGDPKLLGSLDGPGENLSRGVFTGVTIERGDVASASSIMALGMARLLATEPGHDVIRGLQDSGWVRRETTDGSLQWDHLPSGAAVDGNPIRFTFTCDDRHHPDRT